jgi:hypothetical protein
LPDETNTEPRIRRKTLLAHSSGRCEGVDAYLRIAARIRWILAVGAALNAGLHSHVVSIGRALRLAKRSACRR